MSTDSRFTAERPPRAADVRTALDVIEYARDLVNSVNLLNYGRPDATLAAAQEQLEKVMPWVTPERPQHQGRSQHRKGGRR